MENRTALIFGATGLVGRCLVDELKDHGSYSSIDVFVRKPMHLNHPKIREHVIDFERLEEWAPLVKGDDLFICIGTTIRKAGSVRRMEEIDRDMPVALAALAFAQGVKRLAVVSSMGADASSRNYYMRIKGEMEAGIRKLPFKQIVIARPSMLFGERNEFRFGEFIGRIVMKGIGFMLVGPARKYRGIHGRTVAAAMIELLSSPRQEVVYLSDALQDFG